MQPETLNYYLLQTALNFCKNLFPHLIFTITCEVGPNSILDRKQIGIAGLPFLSLSHIQIHICTHTYTCYMFSIYVAKDQTRTEATQLYGDHVKKSSQILALSMLFYIPPFQKNLLL